MDVANLALRSMVVLAILVAFALAFRLLVWVMMTVDDWMHR